MRVKHSSHLTLRDKLSRLTLIQAQRLLGPQGAHWLAVGGKIEIDTLTQVRLTDESCRISFPGIGVGVGDVDSVKHLVQFGAKTDPLVVTLALHPGYRDRLQIGCNRSGEAALLHQGASLAMLLEEKTSLGLAAAPIEDTPWELLSEELLETRALAEREQRSLEEKMTVKATDATTPWTDYLVASAASGKTYRVALRGRERGQNYCSCPDFRKNALGTCKHVFKVQASARRKFGLRGMAARWMPDRIAVFARYDGDLRLGLEAPACVSSAARKIIKPWQERTAREPGELVELFEAVRALSQLGEDVLVYPDAEEFLAQALHSHRMSALVAAIRRDPRAHPLRRDLLKSELLAYQLDGVAFAAGAGRAVLADEMGLGKTIQGVGVAELLARHAGITRVLVVCPASLKAQWRAEINRFCAREVQLVSGKSAERNAQYAGGAFFTVCNYEQVLRDFLDIERSKWDLIILDEAQRIKNWEAKTSRIIKSLRSPYALVLTGTPLENRLDDLYSVIEFIDPRRLGPAYRFINRHRVASETGKVLGYKNLEVLRAHLKPVLLRRTRASVALELPRRTIEIVRVTPTDEQLQLHGAQMQVVQTITRKPFLTEMDLLRLQKALLLARMSANSTALVDKQLPGYSTKLERVGELIETLCAEPARKIILFSEWTGMLDLIEPLLKRAKAAFVRLDGSVPQKQRSRLVATFQSDANCRAFLTTNAGSTGLNLQAADTVINLELPWNPALLEQRIARAHRMGQKRPVQVYLMITENTIEENLLATLSAKHELAVAVLDPDSELREVNLASGIEELKRRLEALLGAKPEGAPDVSTQERAEADLIALAQRKERVAEAGGQLLAAAFSFLGEILPAGTSQAPAPEAVAALKAGLAECVETAEDGKLRLAVTLPGMQSLDALAAALAKLMAARESGSAGEAGAT